MAKNRELFVGNTLELIEQNLPILIGNLYELDPEQILDTISPTWFTMYRSKFMRPLQVILVSIEAISRDPNYAEVSKRLEGVKLKLSSFDQCCLGIIDLLKKDFSLDIKVIKQKIGVHNVLVREIVQLQEANKES